MDPATIASLAKIALPFFTTAPGPTQAQVNAAVAAQAADERQKWMIAGALLGGAALVYLLASRR
jgi:hypothetical protein